MMNLLIMSFLTSCIMFIYMKHPLSLGMTLLFQTITVSLITGMINFNFWFSYILFLVMIGGLLILFIYMTSIISNKKFKFNFKLFLMVTLTICLMSIIMLLMDQYLSNFVTYNSYSLELDYDYQTYTPWNKYMSYPNYFIMILLFNYLLLNLIGLAKICKIKEGSLWQKL